MSAYIVADETINRIISFLSDKPDYAKGLKLNFHKDRQRLSKKMSALNYLAANSVNSICG